VRAVGEHAERYLGNFRVCLPIAGHQAARGALAAHGIGKDGAGDSTRMGGQLTMPIAGDCEGAGGALPYDRVRRLRTAARGMSLPGE
jgi:hypothetical protein